jgi:DNA repair exonuclease SbcCD ATPase subunit
MDAWRKLVHLAFDISASDERTLPDTLATIIEGQKSRKEEELQLDLNAIVEEAYQLREEGDRITRIRNASDSWEKFDETFQLEKQLRGQAAKAYADLNESVEVEEGRLREAQEKASRALNEAETRTETLGGIKRDTNNSVTNTDAEVKAAGKQVDRIRTDINAAHATLNEFPGMPRQEIVESLDEHIAEQEKDIKGYNDKDVAQEDYTRTCERLTRNERQAKRLYEQLTNRTPTLLDDLTVSDASILNSMNRSLGRTHGALTHEQKQAFTQFSQLFRSEDGHLVLGQPPESIALSDISYQEYDAEKTRQDMKGQLDELKARNAQDKKHRDKLLEEATKSPEEIAKLRLEAEKEIDKAQKDKNALNALDANLQAMESLKGELRENKEKLEEQKRQYAKADTEWREADENRRKVRQEHQALKDQVQQVRLIRQRLDRIGKDANNVLEGRHKVIKPTPCEVSEANIEALQENVDDLSALRNKVHEQLRMLFTMNIVPNADSQAHLSSFTGDQVADFHEQLKAVFDNLDTQEANYRHQVDRHNKTTHSQVEILRSAKQLVSAFISGINAEMGQFSISDLEEVRVDYKLHPRFEQLLADLEKADLLSDELQDKKVYEQLKAFQADFFNADARRTGILLSLDKILAGVHYKYRKRDEEGWTTNAQSNGTTMMITTNLLSVLMSRLMDSDAQVTMPLVMDEFGSLATQNMRTARQIAEQHSYCLFVANPNRDSKITQVLGNYVHLGLFHATQAYAENRTVVHHGLCESLARKGTLTRRLADTKIEGASFSEEEADL